MLAGVRNVACGAAMAMAGILAVMLAYCVWIIVFFSDADARWFFFGPPPGGFAHDLWIGGGENMVAGATRLLGLAVVIWLIALVIRRAWLVR